VDDGNGCPLFTARAARCSWLGVLLAGIALSGCKTGADWEREVYQNMPKAVYDPDTGERISPGVI
jgi:hypothetical protein